LYLPRLGICDRHLPFEIAASIQGSWLAAFQGAHRSHICLWVSKFHAGMFSWNGEEKRASYTVWWLKFSQQWMTNTDNARLNFAVLKEAYDP
jgi:hypothetical protein